LNKTDSCLYSSSNSLEYRFFYSGTINCGPNRLSSYALACFCVSLLPLFMPFFANLKNQPAKISLPDFSTCRIDLKKTFQSSLAF